MAQHDDVDADGPRRQQQEQQQHHQQQQQAPASNASPSNNGIGRDDETQADALPPASACPVSYFPSQPLPPGHPPVAAPNSIPSTLKPPTDPRCIFFRTTEDFDPSVSTPDSLRPTPPLSRTTSAAAFITDSQGNIVATLASPSGKASQALLPPPPRGSAAATAAGAAAAARHDDVSSAKQHAPSAAGGDPLLATAAKRAATAAASTAAAASANINPLEQGEGQHLDPDCTLVLASRNSQLALIQSSHVSRMLEAHFGRHSPALLPPPPNHAQDNPPPPGSSAASDAAQLTPPATPPPHSFDAQGNATLRLPDDGGEMRFSPAQLRQHRSRAHVLGLAKPCRFPITSMSTSGDQNLRSPLYVIGGEGRAIWTKELEVALVAGGVDAIVHSLKDVPTTLPEGLCLAAILEREDPRDALVVKAGLPYKTLDELPAGSVIGTSSVRRVAQLRRRYPELVFSDVRGNLNTRLAKLDSATGPYTALVLAAAGLIRLSLSHRITAFLSAPVLLHSVGQGSLGIEVRRPPPGSDPRTNRDARILEMVQSVGDWRATWRCAAERSLLRELEGGCSIPVGVESRFEDHDEVEGLRNEGVGMLSHVLRMKGWQEDEVQRHLDGHARAGSAGAAREEPQRGREPSSDAAKQRGVPTGAARNGVGGSVEALRRFGAVADTSAGHTVPVARSEAKLAGSAAAATPAQTRAGAGAEYFDVSTTKSASRAVEAMQTPAAETGVATAAAGAATAPGATAAAAAGRTTMGELLEGKALVEPLYPEDRATFVPAPGRDAIDLTLTASVVSLDGKRQSEFTLTRACRSVDDAESLGVDVARELASKRGARTILDEVERHRRLAEVADERRRQAIREAKLQAEREAGRDDAGASATTEGRTGREGDDGGVGAASHEADVAVAVEEVIGKEALTTSASQAADGAVVDESRHAAAGGDAQGATTTTTTAEFSERLRRARSKSTAERLLAEREASLARRKLDETLLAAQAQAKARHNHAGVTLAAAATPTVDAAATTAEAFDALELDRRGVPREDGQPKAWEV